MHATHTQWLLLQVSQLETIQEVHEQKYTNYFHNTQYSDIITRL